MALAVYPILNSNFSIEKASQALNDSNFSSLRTFQAQVDSLSNYTYFVKISFNIHKSQQMLEKHFYFGTLN